MYQFSKQSIKVEYIFTRFRNEIEEMGWNDIQALSTFLGQKDFMFGDTPTELDAVVFGKAKPDILPMHDFTLFS